MNVTVVPLAAKISLISSGGEVTIVFSDDIMIFANLTSIDKSMLRLTVIPSSDSLAEDLLFEWTATSMTSRILKLSLEFLTPLKVSSMVSLSSLSYI